LNTKEIALVSVFSAVWIAAQISLGPIISQITGIHGVIQSLVGWLLMLIVAELTGKFGRVSIMAAVAALATRMIRTSPALYIWVVGLGYALGGLTFDLLFFIPVVNNLEEKGRKAYILTISLISGVVANVPYVLFKLFTLLIPAFLIWIPTYVPLAVKDLILNVLGVIVGLSILPLIKPWSTRISNKQTKVLKSQHPPKCLSSGQRFCKKHSFETI